MVCDRQANLKYKYDSRYFWGCGYYVGTKKTITEYIQERLREGEMMDQVTMKEYIASFTGSKNKRA